MLEDVLEGEGGDHKCEGGRYQDVYAADARFGDVYEGRARYRAFDATAATHLDVRPRSRLTIVHSAMSERPPDINPAVAP